MPLMDYLDSLLAVEISSWIERELGAKVTIMELMKGPSIAQLVAALLARVDVDVDVDVDGDGDGAQAGAPVRPGAGQLVESARA
jgi:Phosphopantetheine attachment site